MAKYSRSMIVELAKAIRNSTMSLSGRQSVVREMHKIFVADNQLYPADVFRKIANAELEDDYANRKGVKKDAEI